MNTYCRLLNVFRITDNLAVEILRNTKYGVKSNE